jgi:signal transduction histidine kinase
MLDRAALDTIVRPRRDSAPVELLLLNADLEILAGSNRALLGNSLPLWENRLIEGGKHEHDDEQIYSAVDPAGEELLVSRLPLQAYRALPRLDWTVVASLPEQLAFLPLTKARNYIVLLVLAAIVLGIAMAWTLAESVARPIKELTLVTQRIAREGTLEAVPDPGSNDEVGELARSFQTMVENVTAAHDELVQSSKLAFLGELAAGMAHEIRTPLGIIKNSAQLLERRALEADDKEAQEFSRFIQGESDRLNSTVDELLDLSRPTPLKKSPASINAIVERATGFLSTEALSRKVSLSADLAPSLPETRCDPEQLFQVLLNLTMNSLQVSTPGSSVLISTRRLGDELEIAVTDDGPGIPPDLLGTLFTPFVSQREGGLGLGLAIVKRIVEAHGGKVSGKNLQAAGARFALTLPISAPGDSDDEIV